MSALRLQAPPLSLFSLEVNPWTEPFWRAAADGKLVAARCQDCATFRHPPVAYCGRCQSQRIEYVELSGEGEIYSFTVVRRAVRQGLSAIVPYVPAVVSLPDAPGVRMVGAIVGCDVEEVRIGLPVVVHWVAGEGDARFAHWRLKRDGE